MALAVFLVATGLISDGVGHRPVFTGGLIVFSLASLGCGVAPIPIVLHLMRAVQGVGGAAMFASSLALLAREFQGPDRGLAFGAWGAAAGAAVALGPLIGGVITESLSWRWIFLVNVPVGLFAASSAWWRLSRTPRRTVAVDWYGLMLLSVSLLGFVFGCLRGNATGWGSPQIIGSFALSAATCGLFILVELRVRYPLIDLRRFRDRTFAAVSVTAFAGWAATIPIIIYLALFFQAVLEYSPIGAGLRVLPATVLILVVSPIAGKLSSQVNPRLLIATGLGSVALGLGLMHGVASNSKWTMLLPGMSLMGLGVGLVNPPLSSLAVTLLGPAHTGLASAVNNTFRQVGTATGIAVLGAVFQQSVQSAASHSLARARIPGAGAIARAEASNTGLPLHIAAPPGLQATILDTAHRSFVTGFNEIITVAAAVAFAGALVALALPRNADGAGRARGEPAHDKFRVGPKMRLGRCS